ncbi:MAG: MurT ligase domain-containing protein [Firmicutes bacterium]|nr:MurT ligase domain-containing protein [Bacillota bacterium]
MKIWLSAAIAAGKIASWLSRFRGNKGSSLPGLVARKVYSGTLKDLAVQVRKGIVVVSGTNGKTTTINMIAQVLTGAGHRIIVNREGANLIAGVTTSFVMGADIFGNIDCDYAVLEVDEASMPGVLAEVRPRAVALTNFFRDQLDRYWELDKIIGVIRDTLKELKHTTLVLNADDPLVAQFRETTGLSAVYYGLAGSERSNRNSSQTRESKFCPFCSAPLLYDFFHYGQLGAYRCPGCGFKRPGPQVEALDPKVVDGVTGCRLFYRKREVSLAISTQGLYNLYNAMAAFSVCLLLGVDVGTICENLRKYRPVIGRMERFTYRGKPVFLSLVKNPTGFNEGLAALQGAPGIKDVFIAINDNDADGRDVSWLWDVDFEVLGACHRQFARFICSGRRGEEMAVRLKYAGVPVEKISVITDMRSAIKCSLAGGAGTAYLFSTYTALWPVHKIVSQLASKESADDQRMPSVS